MRFPFDDEYEFEYDEADSPFRGMSPKMMALFTSSDESKKESAPITSSNSLDIPEFLNPKNRL